MRRMFGIIIMLGLAISIAGCTANSAAEELVNYINIDCREMEVLENKVLISYESVSGSNYVSDSIMYKEITTNTIVYVRELNEKALNVASSIEDPKILEVHRIYINYTSKMLNAMGIIASALQKQDITLMTQANQALNEANNLALDYKTAVFSLAKEYNVTITNL